MATIASSSTSPVAHRHHLEPGFLAAVRAFWHRFAAKAFDPYRPELHYMRGPGPAWRAKQVASSHLHST
jgi:hypothetical protein